MNSSFEKPTKKATRQKLKSALPVAADLRIKTTDMFPMSPKDLNKFKKISSGKIEVNKKPKKKQKLQSKKIDTKEVEKILQKSITATKGKKESSEEYPYVIKKNIVNLQTEKKKKAKEPGKKKTEKTNNLPIPKTVSEPVKKIKNTSPKPIKSEGYKAEILKASATKSRATTATLKPNNKFIPQTSHYTTYFQQTKENPALILYPQVTSFSKNIPKITKTPKPKTQKAGNKTKKLIPSFLKNEILGPMHTHTMKKNSSRFQTKFGDSELKITRKSVEHKKKTIRRNNLKQINI